MPADGTDKDGNEDSGKSQERPEAETAPGEENAGKPAGSAASSTSDGKADEQNTDNEAKASDLEARRKARRQEVIREEFGDIQYPPDHPVWRIHDDPGPPPPLPDNVATGPSDKVLRVMSDIDSMDFVELTHLVQEFMKKLDLKEMPTLQYGGADAEGRESSDSAAKDTAGGRDTKSTYDVKLTGFGEKAKIKVIKEVRTITGLGLREAKELVDSLPKVVKESVKKEDGESIMAKLIEAGGTAELE